MLDRSFPPHAAARSGLTLTTLGAPRLRREGVALVPPSRKCLALLTYLCLERSPLHSRTRLATLLWSDSSEALGRHSLTQTLRQLRTVLGPEAIVVHAEEIEWRGAVECDALVLQQIASGARPADDDLELYAGDFLAEFTPGPGGSAFELWAEHRRALYRATAVRVLQHASHAAVAREAWSEALARAARAVEIEPLLEEGHRLVMHALSALGERSLALQHYETFAGTLRREFGVEPDPATQALADAIRAARPAQGGTLPPARPLDTVHRGR